MKVLVSLLALFTLCSGFLYADVDKPITFYELPKNSQEFIKTFFPNDKVAFAKVEKQIFDLKYDVLLVSGSKLEFYKNGSWKEVNCKYSSVPLGVIPLPISGKINELYPNKEVYITEMRKGKKEDKIKLNTVIERKFDFNYNLLIIDN